MSGHHLAPAPAPMRCVLPKVTGDAGAADRLGVAYGQLSDEIYAVKQRIAAVVASLATGWRGPGHRALDEPAERFLRDAAQLSRVLDEAAGAYAEFGQRLEAAHEAHRWSVHKVLKVGAIAAVSATAVVVTVGAASVVEAATATAAVSGAAEASEAGLVADAVAANALNAAMEALPALRPLLQFTLPHLIQAEWVTGAAAVWDEGTTDRLPWRALGETALLGFSASGASAGGRSMIGESKWGPHLIEGVAWGGATAVNDELADHRLNIVDIAETFILAGGSTAGRDALRARGVWPEAPNYRRDALVRLLRHPGAITDREIAHELSLLRQPVRELERGSVDLRLHEGPGHTIERHVGKTAAELRARLAASRIPRASTYWDQAGARDAIEATLTANRATIRGWIAAGSPATLRLRMTSAYDVGFVLDRRGTVHFVRNAIVVLRRDQAGVVMVTSYPVK